MHKLQLPSSSLRRSLARGSLRSRSFHATHRTQQQAKAPNPHGNFYRTHGRALFKALTLSFFSYQCFYWAWITLETEALKDGKNREIKSLQGEVRLLEEGKNSHQPGVLSSSSTTTRLLEEKKA